MVALLDDVRQTGFNLPMPQIRSSSAADSWKFGSPGKNLGGKKPFTGNQSKRGQFMTDITTAQNLRGQNNLSSASNNKARRVLNKFPKNLIDSQNQRDL